MEDDPCMPFFNCILDMLSNGNHTKQRKWILLDYCNVMINTFFMITNNKFLDCFTSNSYNPWWFHTKFLAWAHFKKPIDGPYVGIMYISHFLPSFQIALKVYVKVQWVKPWASRRVTSKTSWESKILSLVSREIFKCMLSKWWLVMDR